MLLAVVELTEYRGSYYVCVDQADSQTLGGDRFATIGGALDRARQIVLEQRRAEKRVREDVP